MGMLHILLTCNEVADELRIHPATVRRLTREGKLPFITLPGGSRRYRREIVEAILAGDEDLPSVSLQRRAAG